MLLAVPGGPEIPPADVRRRYYSDFESFRDTIARHLGPGSYRHDGQPEYVALGRARRW
jgi:hypothetical protein